MESQSNNKNEEKHKIARILWHEIFDNKGPLMGVAEHNNEKYYFCRNNEDKYDLRKIKEESLEIVIKNHKVYRDNNGGHRDHDPERHSARFFKKDTLDAVVTPLFNYYPHADKNIFITLSKEDFDWFYPPRILKSHG